MGSSYSRNYEQELPLLPLVTIVTLFGTIAFTMNDKGHGKINNLFWGAFANFAGLIYVGARGYKKGLMLQTKSKCRKRKKKSISKTTCKTKSCN